jgi:hypothetical protein
VEVVPSLGYLSSAIVGGASTSSSLVVSGTAAADVGQSTVSLGKSVLELADGVGGSVARYDASLVQPAPSRETAVVENGCLEELNDFFVFSVFRAIARHVEGGEASSVLAELVLVKLVVRSALVDPVLAHPCYEVIFAKRLDQAQNAGAFVRWDDGTVGQLIGSVG